jgi:hypothetical protein
LREERRLWLFKNRLRHKRDEVNRELQENAKRRPSWFVFLTKYHSDNIKRMKWADNEAEKREV